MIRANINSLNELIKSPSGENNNLILKEQLNYLKKLAKKTNIEDNITQLCNYYQKKVLLFHKNFEMKKIIENLSFVPLNEKINDILEEKNKKINNLLKIKKLKLEKKFPCENFFQIADKKIDIICDKKKKRPKSNLNYTIEGVKDWLVELHNNEEFSKKKIKKIKDKFSKKKEKKLKLKKSKLLKEKKEILKNKKKIIKKNKLTRKINIEKIIKLKEKKNMKDSNFFELQKKNREIEKVKQKKLKLKLSEIKNFYRPMDFNDLDNFAKKEDKRKKKLVKKRKKLLKLNKIIFKKEIKPLIKKHIKDKDPEILTNSLFSETFIIREKKLKRRKLLKNRSQFSLKVKKCYLPKLARSFKKNEFNKEIVIFDFEKKQKENYQNFLQTRKFGLENLKESKKLVKSFKIQNHKKIYSKKIFEKKSEKINYKNYLKHEYSEKCKDEINRLTNVIKKNKENFNSKTVNKIKCYFNQYDSKLNTNRFEPKKVINSISAKLKFLERINK